MSRSRSRQVLWWSKVLCLKCNFNLHNLNKTSACPSWSCWSSWSGVKRSNKKIWLKGHRMQSRVFVPIFVFLSKFCKKCRLNHVNPSRNGRDIPGRKPCWSATPPFQILAPKLRLVDRTSCSLQFRESPVTKNSIFRKAATWLCFKQEQERGWGKQLPLPALLLGHRDLGMEEVGYCWATPGTLSVWWLKVGSVGLVQANTWLIIIMKLGQFWQQKMHSHPKKKLFLIRNAHTQWQVIFLLLRSLRRIIMQYQSLFWNFFILLKLSRKYV